MESGERLMLTGRSGLKTLFVTLVFAVALVVGMSLTGSAQEPQLEEGRLPSEDPCITGLITDIGRTDTGDLWVRVEEDQTVTEPRDAGGQKLILYVTEDSVVLRLAPGNQDGDTEIVSPTELALGQEISAWVPGPLLLSYPARGGAGVILILGDAGGS